ncbi:MAG: SRPBCC domain-containing protein [Gemmatimonadaceae bacterium]
MNGTASIPVADYRCEISAPVSAKQAFDKIGRVSEWWKTDSEEPRGQVGDVFTVRFGADTFVTFRVSELTPGVSTAWDVTDCYLSWLKDKTEWTGTKAVWKVSEKDHVTTIQFAHIGLVPVVECYDMCVKGWDQYVKGSLLALLTLGKGQPS